MADSPAVRPNGAAPVWAPVTGAWARRNGFWACKSLLATVGRIIGAWLRRAQVGLRHVGKRRIEHQARPGQYAGAAEPGMAEPAEDERRGAGTAERSAAPVEPGARFDAFGRKRGATKPTHPSASCKRSQSKRP